MLTTKWIEVKTVGANQHLFKLLTSEGDSVRETEGSRLCDLFYAEEHYHAHRDVTKNMIDTFSDCLIVDLCLDMVHVTRWSFARSVFRNMLVESCKFTECDFTKVKFFNVTFRDCDFINCRFNDALFSNESVEDCFGESVTMVECNFENADLRDIFISPLAHLDNCNLLPLGRLVDENFLWIYPFRGDVWVKDYDHGKAYPIQDYKQEAQKHADRLNAFFHTDHFTDKVLQELDAYLNLAQVLAKTRGLTQ